MEFLFPHSELLIVLHLTLHLAVCDYLVDFHPQKLKIFVHVLVPLQNEYAPTVRCRVLLHQQLQNLQVSPRYVVHSPVYLAYVHPEYRNLVPVQTVLQETQVNMHLELCQQTDLQTQQVLPAVSAVVQGHFLHRIHYLVNR